MVLVIAPSFSQNRNNLALVSVRYQQYLCIPDCLTSSPKREPMTWTKPGADLPAEEGWYIVHHSIDSLPSDTSYWMSMSYKALYWHPGLGVWTENARRPGYGGEEVEIEVLTWSVLNCLEEATLLG